MKKLINRILRRLIIKNRYFLREASPRLPKEQFDTSYIFTGNDAMVQMENNAATIFKGFDSDTSVLIKINLNSAFDYPASTSMEMIESVIDSLKKIDVKNICVSDCTSLSRLPSKSIMVKKGITGLKKAGVKLSSFDYGPWRKINIRGQYYKEIILPKLIYKYDRIINLSNLKTHKLAGFTSATKNLVGLMHPYQRFELHKNNLQERVAELSLAIIPDLNIIDARKIFIDGGPDKGTVIDANTVIIDSNLLRADISAYNVLLENQTATGLIDLENDYTKNTFFKHFLKINGDAV